MTEAFLHYIWQFQYFNHSNLLTTDGQALSVLKVGRLNRDAGPDFVEARLLLNDIEWVGQVEIHLKASDWYKHQHQQDAAYENVILHVVWEADRPIVRSNGTLIPTLELQTRTDTTLWHKYEALYQSKEPIPCAAQFGNVSTLTVLSMLDKALMRRLERKATDVADLLRANQSDWEETTYQVLAQNFGFKLNAEPFLRLAQRLPLKALQKHRNQPIQVEAMLFGTAGFLQAPPTDHYQATLQQEFRVLAAKYSLHDKVLGLHEWKFLRLRPANFPTVRLAQFAQLIAQQPSLFSLLIHTAHHQAVVQALRVKQSDYWRRHYVFGKEATTVLAGLGKTSANNVLINTVVPLLACYAQHKDSPDHLERATALLESLPAEANHITALYEALGLQIKSAFDSQAVIELNQSFCRPKRCLDCTIGVHLVR